MIIHTFAYPRAGLVGNPSDGYFGRTIAFTFSNFRAEVMLYQTPELEILPSERDHSRFTSIQHLVDDVNLYGYYGGIRLLKAAVKRFFDHCAQNHIVLDERNFTLRYRSSIPHHVGLAGSSAIITACMKALMAFYQVPIPKPALANLILAVEREELRIAAGLQDRVAQVYEGLVFMDFDRNLMETQGSGEYENLDTCLLPPLYIAYLENLAEISDVFHNNIRERYDRGEPEVLDAMGFWADLTTRVRDNLLAGQGAAIAPLLNSNFDRRRTIYRISEANLRMIDTARSTGASAKFSGSGGAIVGTYEGEPMFEHLVRSLEPLGVRVLKPVIATREE
jgi:glucuronokinase